MIAMKNINYFSRVEGLESRLESVCGSNPGDRSSSWNQVSNPRFDFQVLIQDSWVWLSIQVHGSLFHVSKG